MPILGKNTQTSILELIFGLQSNYATHVCTTAIGPSADFCSFAAIFWFRQIDVISPTPYPAFEGIFDQIKNTS